MPHRCIFSLNPFLISHQFIEQHVQRSPAGTPVAVPCNKRIISHIAAAR